MVCTRGLVKVHRVSQDGPPEPGSHFFYLPWPQVTFEQEKIVKKMITRSVFGLDQYNLVKEIHECSKHGDAFRTGAEAAHWCSECRILLRRISKQKPMSTKLLRTGPIPDDINNHTPDLAKYFKYSTVRTFLQYLLMCLTL